MFPHHENEVAQSTCAHGGKVFARWWLHHGMLTFGGRKMSKSLGNTLVLHELLERYPAELLRFALMRAHYRQPLDWSDSTLDQARRTLDGLYGTLRELSATTVKPDDLAPPVELIELLADDLNTPEALALLSRLADKARRAGSAEERQSAKRELLGAGWFLGLLQQDPEAWFKASAVEIDAAWVERLLGERAEARRNQDYAKSDRIRDELAAAGVIIEDGPQGARWKVAPPTETRDERPA